MLGPSATPSIYANVLMTRIQGLGTRETDGNNLSREAKILSNMDVLDEATFTGATFWSLMALQENTPLSAHFIAEQEKNFDADLHFIYRGLWVEHSRLCRAVRNLLRPALQKPALRSR